VAWEKEIVLEQEENDVRGGRKQGWPLHSVTTDNEQGGKDNRKNKGHRIQIREKGRGHQTVTDSQRRVRVPKADEG